MTALMDTYARLPVAFTHGEGAWLYDEQGHAYLDALSGLAVCGLGHAHPRVTEAISQQAQRLLHSSNLYHIPLQERLAERLTTLAGMDKAFFCNSGAEANEAAIKLARLHGRAREIKQPHIVVMEHAFHGRTMATLTATGSRKVQAGFEPLLGGFVRAPLNDIKALETIAANNASIVAVLLEPILGEGGVRLVDDAYLAALRRLCDERGWLLILDEVQTGNARTGRFFAYQHGEVRPDVVTTAKGLGNGVPIGACLARGAAAELLKPGSHGSTFGGNPLACAAAEAVLQSIEAEGLLERAEQLGARIRAGLEQGLAGDNRIVEIRGRGLMIGVELSEPCPRLVERGLAERVLINVTEETVLRLLPPLTLSDAEADELVQRVLRALEERSS